MPVDMNRNIRHALDTGYTFNLSSAFIWGSTPQGHGYWSGVVEAGQLTAESRQALMSLVGLSEYETPKQQEQEEDKVEYTLVSLSLDDTMHSLQVRRTSDNGLITSGPKQVDEEDFISKRFDFDIDSYWRSGYTLRGTGTTEDSHVTAVAKVKDCGGLEVFGELNLVQKAFRFKSVADYHVTMMRIFSGLTPVDRSEVYNWESRELLEIIVDKVVKTPFDYRAMTHSCSYFQPKFSPEGVSFYSNPQDLERNRRTTTTFGRYLRKVAPQLSDAQIEACVDRYNKMYKKRDFVLKRGKSRSDFAHAYNGKQAEMLNPRTNSARKSLANSCMRNMRIEGMSPAEVFASGDFEIIWIEDDKGLIGGRVVVYLREEGKPQAGPLYGVCEHSLDLLEAELKEMDADLYDDADWSGAKLLRIPVYSNDLLMIYCDMAEEGYDDGDYIILNHRHSNVCVQTTQGYIGSGDSTSCTACEDRVHEDDVYTNTHGECYCEMCYNDLYSYCDVEHEEVDRDEAVTAFTSQPCYCYCASVECPCTITVGPNVSTAECYYTDELWLTEDMEVDVDGNLVSPRYALTMFNIRGDLYSKEQLDREGLNEDGTPVADPEEEEKEEAA